MQQQILVAGLGNIFLGDDAFGVEVVHALMQKEVHPSVRVADFGIRSYDLAYALADGYDLVILVDTVQRGNPPGTLYLIEPQPGDAGKPGLMNGHALNPLLTLRMVQSFSGKLENIYLVGCEPAVFETDEGTMGLSPAVQAIVPRAIEMIMGVIDKHIITMDNPFSTRREVSRYA